MTSIQGHKSVRIVKSSEQILMRCIMLLGFVGPMNFILILSGPICNWDLYFFFFFFFYSRWWLSTTQKVFWKWKSGLTFGHLCSFKPCVTVNTSGLYSFVPFRWPGPLFKVMTVQEHFCVQCHQEGKWKSEHRVKSLTSTVARMSTWQSNWLVWSWFLLHRRLEEKNILWNPNVFKTKHRWIHL